MTESLKVLQETRMQKTAWEVEDEFKTLQDKKNQELKGTQAYQAQTKKNKSVKLFDYELDEEEQL